MFESNVASIPFTYLIKVKKGKHKGKFYSFPHNVKLIDEFFDAKEEIKKEKEKRIKYQAW